jgi:hypothetical protein
MAAALGSAAVALVVAGVARRVVLRVHPDDYARSIELFSAGGADFKADPSSHPQVWVPRLLPGPADDWAGGRPHALRLPLGQRPARALVLYVSGRHAPRGPPWPDGPLRDARADLPTRIAVMVNGNGVGQIESPSGRQTPGRDGETPFRSRIRVPASALPGGVPLELALVNQAGAAVAIDDLRLIEATPTFAWRHLRRTGRLPDESLVFVVASLVALLLWTLTASPGASVASRGVRAAGPAVALLALAETHAMTPEAFLVEAIPRWAWLAVPWGLCALVWLCPPKAPARRIGASSRVKRVLTNTLLLLASVAVSLVAAEFAVRFALRHVTSSRDTRTYFRNRARAQVNRLGFRERNLAMPKPLGTYRIAVIGDSLAWGVGVPTPDRFSNRIERALADHGGPGVTYELLNFSEPGWDTAEELDALRAVVLNVSPDFVLLQWYVNDFENGFVAARPRPMALVPWDGLDASLYGTSALYTLLAERWLVLQESLGLTETYPSYMYRRFHDPDGPDSRAALDTLREFLDECARHHIPVSIVLFPHVDDTLSHGVYRYAYLHDRVLAVCRRQQIACVDLRSTFAPYTDYRTLWVTDFDAHPSSLAHRLAAEQVMEALGASWLKAGSRGVARAP